MNEVTIVALVGAVITLAAFIKAVVYLRNEMKKVITGTVSPEIADMNEKIDELKSDMNQGFSEVNKKIDKSDMEACQNFLVHCLTDFDRGIGDDAMLQRFWKQYDYYIDHDGNSYIKSRVEDLKASGKLRRLK